MSTTTRNALVIDAPAGVPWIDFHRDFDAPVEALFNAHRDPDLVRCFQIYMRDCTHEFLLSPY